MWHAQLDGVDLAPPLNLWMTRAAAAAIGTGPVLTRLPAFAGFSLMLVAVFVGVRRRAGTIAAITAALLPLFTAGLRYASEARAYGLMMGLSAAALYAWMEAAAGRRRAWNLILLATALGASIWNHYFGVLAFAPVIAGEATRTLRSRRLDRGVALAIAAAVLTAAPLYPLLHASSTQRATFWAKADAGQIADVYAFLLNAWLSTPFAIACAAVALLLAGAWWLRTGGVDDARRIPAAEAVAIAVAAAIPVLGLALGRFVTGVFVPRYVLSAVPGLSIGAALLLWRCNTRQTIAELVACLTAVIVATSSVIGAVRSAGRPYDPLAGRALLVGSLRSPEPTVVAGSLQYLQYWYYLPPELKTRVTYLADPDEALRRTGSDTIDRGYLALARWVPVRVDAYSTFLSRHRSFRVYDGGSGWLLDALKQRASDVQPALLAVRQLPAGLADQLVQPGRHPGDQLAEPQLVA